MLVVIDTNVLVSALWSRSGKPAQIVSLIQNRLITPCFDHRMLIEYREVLKRPRFGFDEKDVNDFLSIFTEEGLSITAPPLQTRFVDEDDRMFYEVAKQAHAFLITGNLKHYPTGDGMILSPADFLENVYLSGQHPI